MTMIVRFCILSFVFLSPVFASMPMSITLPMSTDSWRLVTDNVMGGVSRGQLLLDNQDDKACLRLTGQVSTDNNGGFIQAAIDIDSTMAKQLDQYDGVWITVKGNAESYNIHFRTTYLWLPWQSYRTSFNTKDQWQTLKLPFSEFDPYKTSSRFKPEKIKRLGMVAIGRDFTADLCIAGAGFYRSK